VKKCGYKWLAGEGHGHTCDITSTEGREHDGPHRCRCGEKRVNRK